MDYGLVSIVMPSYNGEKFIKKSIESVINQTYSNWELNIVDDNSNDDTVNIILGMCKRDSRIKLYRNFENKGAALSRNLAIEKSNGKWIAFLDSDDLWDENKLKLQLEFMINNNYNFSCTDYEQVNEQHNSLYKLITSPNIITKKMMTRYCYIGCLTVMYNKDIVGLIQINDIKKRNDYALWLKVIKKTNCYRLPMNLAKYTVRANSISRVSKFKLIKSHYQLFKVSEGKNAFISIILTFQNMFFGLVKKIKYNKNTK